MHSVECSFGTQLTKRGPSSWKRTILLKPKDLSRPWQCTFWYVQCVEIWGSVHTTLEEFENGVFTLKTRQMFLSTLHRRNLKTAFLLWKPVKCFCPHYTAEIWKRRFDSENTSNVSVHTTSEKFENATITGHFGIVFEENSGRGIIWLSRRHRFRKAPFSKCFSSYMHPKTQSRRVQISPVWRAFWKSSDFVTD